MSKSIPPAVRRARLKLARASIHAALAAFRSGHCAGARFAYLDASAWFNRAGAPGFARKAARIGERVVAFQKAGGEHVGPASRLTIGTSPAGRVISMNRR